MRRMIKKYEATCIQFFTYAFGMIIIRSFSLVSLPIMMVVLSPAEYGLLTLANSFIGLLTAFLGLGLRQALPLYYFKYSKAVRSILVYKINRIYLALVIPFWFFALLSMQQVNRYFFLNYANIQLICLSLVIAGGYFFVELIYQLLQYEQPALQVTALQISVALITVICNLFFLCILRLGPISMLLGQAIGMLYILIIRRSILLQKPGESVEPACISMRTYFMQSLTFLPSLLGGVLLASGDRWALARLGTMHDVGIYSVANTLAQFSNILIFSAFSGSYIPFLLKQYVARPEEIKSVEQENRRVMWLCMGAGFIVLYPGFMVIKPVLFLILPAKFHEAIAYMNMLLTGSIWYMGIHFLNCLLQHKQKNIFLGSVLLVPALLNICLNILLIPHYGMYGCVIATLIAYMTYFFVTLGYNRYICRSEIG